MDIPLIDIVYSCVRPYEISPKGTVFFDGLTWIVNDALKKIDCKGCSLISIHNGYVIMTTGDIKGAMKIRDWMGGIGRAVQEHSWAPPNSFYEVRIDDLGRLDREAR